MTTFLAFVSFVIATVVFVLLGMEISAFKAVWGFAFIAAGLALMCLGGAVAVVQSRA